MKYSKLIVILVIVLNIIFTASVLYVYQITKSEPVTLISCWFAFTTGELFLLAGLKINDVKHGKDD